jgi:hypothetical protein
MDPSGRLRDVHEAELAVKDAAGSWTPTEPSAARMKRS